MDISNTAAVVTGGASGLGAATVQRLIAAGARVAVFDLDESRGAALAAETGALFVKVDVSSSDSVSAGLSEAEARHGVARIIVNCAGVGPAIKTVSRGEPFPLETFRKVIDINLVGTFNVLSKAAARMSELDLIGEERGVVINTASVAAFDGQIGQAAYGASKAGVAGMTLPVARDLSSLAIRVMTIAPGLFLTPLLMTVSEEVRESLGAQAPFPRRLGDPKEYAQLVTSIIENPMLNGEVIRLDAAIRMGPR